MRAGWEVKGGWGGEGGKRGDGSFNEAIGDENVSTVYNL